MDQKYDEDKSLLGIISLHDDSIPEPLGSVDHTNNFTIRLLGVRWC